MGDDTMKPGDKVRVVTPHSINSGKVLTVAQQWFGKWMCCNDEITFCAAYDESEIKLEE